MGADELLKEKTEYALSHPLLLPLAAAHLRETGSQTNLGGRFAGVPIERALTITPKLYKYLFLVFFSILDKVSSASSYHL